MPSSMPAVDIEDNEQNAFVQDWLVAWARGHTVFGEPNWEEAARKRAKEFKGTPYERHWPKILEDAALFEHTIELIQETYGGQ